MIVAKDIFTDKQYEESFGTGDNVPAPIVSKTEYQLLDIDGDKLTLMDQGSGECKEDLDLPTEGHLKDVKTTITKLHEEQKKEVLITVQKWGEKEQVISVREGADM